MEDLLGSATPNLSGDRRVQTMVDRLSRDCTPPSRNSFGECAKDGDSAGMRSTIRAPDDRCVLDVLSLQRAQVLAIVFQFPFHHRLCAITASVERMGGRDADIESREEVSEGLCQDVRWAQVCSRNEASHLSLSARVTLVNPGEKLLNYTIMAACALSNGTASRMRARTINQKLTAARARDRLRRASATESDPYRFKKLFVAEDWPMVLAEVP